MRGSDETAGARFAVACAFNENAIWAMALQLSRSRRLAARYVPDWSVTADAVQLLRRPLKGSRSLEDFVARRRAKVASSGLPEDVLVSRLTEPVRVLGARFKSPATPLLGHYAWKAEFDHRASRASRSADVDVVIGLPGSSRRTFLAHPRALKVFHATDTHPRARDHALRQCYGRRAWSEAYPEVLSRRIERELELADVVLVPSRLVGDQMVRHGVAAAKVLRHPYGVDLERFSHVASGARAPNGRRPRLICVGQISLRKGVPLLVEAVRGLDVDLSLAGQVYDRTAVRDLPDNVSLLGVLSPAQLASAYNAHDAFVLPTVDDAFGLVVTEAAASGLRVLTTDAAGAAEVLSDRHLVVPAGDVPALREAIRSLEPLGEEERRATSGEVLSDRTGGIRSWSSYAEDVVAALDARVPVSSR